MDDLRLGYDRYEWLPSNAAATGGRARRVSRVPGQPIHAAREGNYAALCGQPLVEITNRPWPVSMGEACPECRRRVGALQAQPIAPASDVQ